MEADVTEALQERIVTVLSYCSKIRRKIKRLGPNGSQSQRLTLDTVDREIAGTDRAIRELYHRLPEHLRTFKLPKAYGLPEPEAEDPKPHEVPPPPLGGKLPKEDRWPSWTIAEIVELADAYHKRYGKWPNKNSGLINDSTPDTWCGIDVALSHGNRGLPGGTTLAKLLADEKNVRNRTNTQRLDLDTILAWADSHHARWQKWPNVNSGDIQEAEGETWFKINHALTSGHRGLKGNTSLARLLIERRGAPIYNNRPALSEAEILRWADSHHERTGQWPTRDSGDIPEAPGEQWKTINSALLQGNRTLSDKSSLAKLLVANHRKKSTKNLPPFNPDEIVEWARTFFERHGRLPTFYQDGAIEVAPDETWRTVEIAFRAGLRGLAVTGCRSLSKFLDKRIGKLVRDSGEPLEELKQSEQHET